MSDEIVERLRKSADWLVSCACGNIPDDARDWIEAADEIERLRKENDKLVGERDYAIRWANKAVEDVKAADGAPIRQLMSALIRIRPDTGNDSYMKIINEALDHAKAAGYEP